MNRPLLSIVTPAHNEEDNLDRLISEIDESVANLRLDHEIVIVDDGSRDRTAQVASRLANDLDHVRFVRLSRNFGHQPALLAGLRAARGNAVVTMDADLQHPPSLIPRLVDEWRAGADVVHTLRADSDDTGSLKKATSKGFYRFFRAQSGVDLAEGMADFRLVDRRALEPVISSNEVRLFFRGMFVWIGFEQATVPYEAANRNAGTSSYNPVRMFRLASRGIFGFSERLLVWMTWLGIATSALAFAYAGYVVSVRMLSDEAVPGWASQMLVISVMFGILFLFLGVLGGYVAAIYQEVRGRPSYIVADEIGSDPASIYRPALPPGRRG